jgi:flagellar basal body-associated protein FliL
MKKIICLVMLLVGSSLLPAAGAWNDGNRAIKVVKDLSHESGKLGTYHALIIGINGYQDKRIPDLKTPINDAVALEKILREKYGFQVEMMLEGQATKSAVYNKLRKLAANLKPDDSLLIYYAGHGDLDRQYNDGWWIPVDAEAGNPVTYLDNTQVQKAMRNMKARHVLLISDSCYSGTLFGQARKLPRVITDKYYLTLYNDKSRWGMTSGNKTPVSDRGTAGHSVFAYQLIKELKRSDKPFLSTQEIYTRIAPIIANNSEQTPLCRPILNTGDQGGEFVFVASVKKEPKPTFPKVQQSSIDKEMLFWQSIQDSDSPALFEAYIERFPNGFFAPIARQKIETFNQKKVVAFIPSEVSKPKLYVDVEPRDAKVRILNIKPIFFQGIELDPGRYHLGVTAQGYEAQKKWITLKEEEHKRVMIRLERDTKETSLTLGPFVVNLRDADRTRFLRVLIDLELTNYEAREELTGGLPQFKHETIFLLSSKTADELQEVGGKYDLKEELISKINGILHNGKVKNLFFTEFLTE